MIVSQSSAQPTASCSSGTVTGTNRIVTSKGLRCRRGPVKISAGSEAPPHERKIQLKENIACYWLLFGRDSEYWPVIGLLSLTTNSPSTHLTSTILSTVTCRIHRAARLSPRAMMRNGPSFASSGLPLACIRQNDFACCECGVKFRQSEDDLIAITRLREQDFREARASQFVAQCNIRGSEHC